MNRHQLWFLPKSNENEFQATNIKQFCERLEHHLFNKSHLYKNYKYTKHVTFFFSDISLFIFFCFKLVDIICKRGISRIEMNWVNMSYK